jgi:hypothetical protein
MAAEAAAAAAVVFKCAHAPAGLPGPVVAVRTNSGFILSMWLELEVAGGGGGGSEARDRPGVAPVDEVTGKL